MLMKEKILFWWVG